MKISDIADVNLYKSDGVHLTESAKRAKDVVKRFEANEPLEQIYFKRKELEELEGKSEVSAIVRYEDSVSINIISNSHSSKAKILQDKLSSYLNFDSGTTEDRSIISLSQGLTQDKFSSLVSEVESLGLPVIVCDYRRETDISKIIGNYFEGYKKSSTVGNSGVLKSVNEF